MGAHALSIELTPRRQGSMVQQKVGQNVQALELNGTGFEFLPPHKLCGHEHSPSLPESQCSHLNVYLGALGGLAMITEPRC